VKTSGRKIAERYVSALFDVAADARDQVERDLQALGGGLEANAEFQQFLDNPLLTREAQAKTMDALLVKMKAHDLTRRFLTLLASQKRLALLPDIIGLFSQWARTARGELAAELISAGPLKDRDVQMVSERLGKVYGKKMILNVRQDPSLLGGIVVRVGSLQLDSSLAGKMNRLRNKLKVA
jgi:F-type H+-transporting ATPase subunit delta